MNESNNSPQPLAVPSLASLMSRYLASRQDQDQITSEVEPHDAATGFRTNVATTWAEASTVFRVLNLSAERLPAPPDWATFIASDAQEPLPLACGMAPQRYRALALLPLKPVNPLPGLLGLRGWIRKVLKSQSPTELLIAAGLAVEIGDLTDAEAALNTAQAVCTGAWLDAWRNQSGAMLLRQGKLAEAEATWQQLNHAGLKAFNLGLLAALAHQPKRCAELLEQAADALPEESGWSHLARLYSTLAS